MNTLEDCDMEGVIMTDVEKNPISQNWKKSLSKLHLIKDILISKIEVKVLKMFCTKVGIKGQGWKNKKLICDAIAEARLLLLPL